MDLAEYKGSGSSDRSTGSNPESDLNQPRSCADCKTTKTPLWKAGSNGPKGSESRSEDGSGSGSGSSDRSSGSNPESDRDGPRGCTNCKATKTPLWRVGPTGPKSLCNACGIRYQKKMAALAPKVGAKMKNSAKIFRLIGSPSQMRAVMLNLKQGVLREEEEAAVLLMALSSGILCSAQN